MHFINRVFLLLVFLAPSFEIYAQVGLPLTKNFSPDDYKGGIQNWQITQDERGVIYVANNFGLLQFDGNDWRSYSIQEASKLRSIAMGPNNIIYAGCQGDFGYYKTDSAGVLTYYSLKNKIPEEARGIDETWKTYIINNKVYFCTFSKLYEYSNDKIKVISYPKPLDISYSVNNSLFTYVPGEGLKVLVKDKLVASPFGSAFKNQIVSGIISLHQNEWLITTMRNGIFVVDNSSVMPWKKSLNKLFSETFINNALLLSNGNIAIGTQHSGVYIIDQQGQILLHMDKGRGLLSRTILSLYEDQNHNLWVGQNNGITFVELKSPFSQINEELGLPGTGYTALPTEDSLFLGTNNGVFLDTKGKIELIEGSEGQVYSIQSINNTVFVGHNNGALLIENGMAKNIDASTGAWMFLKINNYLLQGTYTGIKIREADNLKELGKVKDLNESSRILVKENDSTIWMSHGYKGIYKIKFENSTLTKSKIEFYNAENKLPTNLYNSVYRINGQLKFSTQQGIFDYIESTDEFELDTNLSSFFIGEQINSLKNDIYGNIYFITNNGVGFLEKTGKSKFSKHTSPFNAIRNLLNDDLPNISIISPNLVLFGAKEGFIVFDRNLFWTTENETFNTIIRQVRSKGTKNDLLYDGNSSMNDLDIDESKRNSTKLTYNNNTVSFTFASTSFSSTLAPEFMYKLNGFDKDWHDWTESNFKEYTNLKEGEYTFQVKSRNASHVESEIANYSFIILPPWYRSSFAYIVYAILTVTALIGFVLVIDKRHQKEKRVLEQKRVTELSEKDRQLDTITKKSETEINQLRNEKLESEIRHINTELATNTMHLLNKNEFINSIKSTLGGVVKKSTNQEVKSQIGRIIKNIEKNIETDGDWDSFQIHFDKVHGDFSKRIQQEFPSLTPQDIKLSAYLRLNLSTKEIANLLNISVRGVEIARYRLRKKLNLERSQNLTEFILNY
ncbi:MAG: hypothetical protein KDC79_16180 [Cyclobacteriaceae bacterium]|nr:hypothetical protein [Cyclobacteriaceae bacterium]